MDKSKVYYVVNVTSSSIIGCASFKFDDYIEAVDFATQARISSTDDRVTVIIHVNLFENCHDVIFGKEGDTDGYAE